jgi:chromosome segregation ATPase
MKRILTAGLVTVFAIPFLSTVNVLAVSDSATTSNTNATTSTGSTSPSNSGSDTATEDKKAITDRIAERKAALKTKLSTAEKTRITTKCKASQGNLSSVKGKLQGIETSRGEVYKNIQTRLTDLSTKLKNKGVDTTALDADIATLKTKIDTFNTDLTAYKQAVSDLATMDCATDPDGFKASLETARTALKKVGEDAKAVRSYLNDTVKPLLKTIRAELEKPSDNSQSGSGDTSTNSGGAN